MVVVVTVVVISRRVQRARKAKLVERVRVPAVAVVARRIASAQPASGAEPNQLVWPSDASTNCSVQLAHEPID